MLAEAVDHGGARVAHPAAATVRRALSGVDGRRAQRPAAPDHLLMAHALPVTSGSGHLLAILRPALDRIGIGQAKGEAGRDMRGQIHRARPPSAARDGTSGRPR